MDFAGITSREAALKLVAEGRLCKILLFPPELGGEDVEANAVYVPPGIPEIKDQLTGTLVRFAGEGLINRLEVVPEYKGSSFVPCRIRIKAWHTDREGRFEPSIDNIW
jgi:hypothetical protein